MNASLEWGNSALGDRHVFGLASLLGASAVGMVVGALLAQAVGAMSESAESVEAPAPVAVIAAVETASPPISDHSVVDWSRVPEEPNVSPLAVGAYE